MLSESQAAAALARITFTGDPALAAEEADLLSESLPEQAKLKGKVLGQFNALCPERTLFTTNSSSLVPSQFAAETVELLHDFARSIDQIPIFVKREHPAYVFNTMFNALLSSAMELAAEDVASV